VPRKKGFKVLDIYEERGTGKSDGKEMDLERESLRIHDSLGVYRILDTWKMYRFTDS
jgi:hypothetical protein